MSDQPNDPDPGNGESPSPEFHPARDLPGAVLMIPNRHWGFEVVSGDDHPGACLRYQPERREGTLVQGTDVENVRNPRIYLNVLPTADNGLGKPTAFRMVPRYFRLHRLNLYFPERFIGRLDGVTLRALLDELARLNPEE